MIEWVIWGGVMAIAGGFTYYMTRCMHDYPEWDAERHRTEHVEMDAAVTTHPRRYTIDTFDTDDESSEMSDRSVIRRKWTRECRDCGQEEDEWYYVTDIGMSTADVVRSLRDDVEVSETCAHCQTERPLGEYEWVSMGSTMESPPTLHCPTCEYAFVPRWREQ